MWAEGGCLPALRGLLVLRGQCLGRRVRSPGHEREACRLLLGSPSLVSKAPGPLLEGAPAFALGPSLRLTLSPWGLLS